jgi:hypothetical protein
MASGGSIAFQMILKIGKVMDQVPGIGDRHPSVVDARCSKLDKRPFSGPFFIYAKRSACSTVTYYLLFYLLFCYCSVINFI